MRMFKFIKTSFVLVMFICLGGSAFARYVQGDPIGLEGGFNRFTYVNGDALNEVDPEGLQSRAAPPPSVNVSNGIAAARVPSLISQIRQYDPNFRYATIAPRGHTYNTQDATFLMDLLRQYETSATCSANGLPRPAINYGSTPSGVPFTRHYGTETAPVRRLPGSLLDSAISTGTPRNSPDGTTSYYDSINNVTVIVGNSGIVSARIGLPLR